MIEISNFGMEIEFGVPRDYSISELYNEFREKDEFGWDIEDDGSVSNFTHRGFEFKTPIFKSIDEIETELVRRLDFIEDNGEITNCSGLHFHFSVGKVNRRNLREYILPSIKMPNERKYYSEKYSIDSETKFQACRKVEYGHYEFRAFNSTSSLDEIVSNFELLKKGIKECQRSLE